MDGYRKEVCKDGIKIFILLYMFYRNVLFLAVLGIPAIFFFAKKEKKNQWEKMVWQKNMEFKDVLQSMSSALAAGYSMEHAVLQAKQDYLILHGTKAVLWSDLCRMEQKLELHFPIEAILTEFGEETKVEDIKQFAEVFATARKTGGNLIAIIRSAAERISEKIEVKREIQTMLAGKKMEAQIMDAVPLAIIAYFQIFSPDFLTCLYTTPMGRISMTVLCAIYLVAYQMSMKISEISV